MSSPWVSELTFENKHKFIDSDLKTDVLIVGAGIAGISSAYFILKNTKLQVTILDSYKVAHGATGHNAGQVVGYFERPYADLVKEFGMEMAIYGQKEVYGAWDLIENIIKEAMIKIDFKSFWGYAGCQNIKELIAKLENDYLRNSGGLDINDCLIDKDWEGVKKIPKHLQNTYKLVHKNLIKSHLDTNSNDFIACLGTKKGTLNSALFCEKVLKYLLEKYSHRISVFEHSKVTNIDLQEDEAISKVRPTEEYLKQTNNNQLLDKAFKIISKKVVLCTNGFKDFKLQNSKKINDNLDAKFKNNLSGLVGFMVGYLENAKRENTAISYFVPELKESLGSATYFYLTRRKYGLKEETLTSIGGPDLLLKPDETFDRQRDYISFQTQKIKDFLQENYLFYPKKEIDFKFKWHGLMGYTNNSLRLIGPEPENQTLLYNLGCNGIGILPSIYGGYKISRILKGEKLEKSIFDPQ